MINNPLFVLVHCSAVSYKKAPLQFWAVNRYHKQRKFPLSSLGYHGGYHFFYEKNGKELRYRQDYEVGAHCNQKHNGVSLNMQSIGLCWAGNGDIELPTPKQVEAIKNRIKKLVNMYKIPIDNVHIVPHRKFTPWKSCYGTLLSDDWAYRLVKQKEPLVYETEAEKEIVALHKKIDIIKQIILTLTILINKIRKGRN